MKTRWTTIRAAAIAAAILCMLSASGAWAAPPLSTDTFPTAYPSGPSYDAAVASLPDLGLLPGGTTDRCDTNGEAELLLVISAFNVAGALEFACDALPPIGREACFVGIAATALANVSAGIAWAQCMFQDGLIDGAETEAAFENTKIIHADLGLHDDRLVTHDQDMKDLLAAIQATLEEHGQKLDFLIQLIQTPTGRRPDFPIN